MNLRWTDPALHTLADIYLKLEPPEREFVARHVEAPNAALADDPWAVSESREYENARVAFRGPVMVRFRLLIGGTVEVHAVGVSLPPRRR